MSTVTVSIGRESLSLPPLVISDDGPVYRFTESGLGYVVQSVRLVRAEESRFIDGSEIVAFAREETALPLELHVIGSSSADLAAKVLALETALYRLAYPVIRTVDGVGMAYTGGPCALVPVRGQVDSGVVPAHFDTFGFTIPFPNPNGVPA